MKYPTYAQIKQASLVQLNYWDQCLDKPINDIERSMRRHIDKRINAIVSEEVRRVEPDLADKWNDLMGKLDDIGLDGSFKL